MGLALAWRQLEFAGLWFEWIDLIVMLYCRILLVVGSEVRFREWPTIITSTNTTNKRNVDGRICYRAGTTHIEVHRLISHYDIERSG